MLPNTPPGIACALPALRGAVAGIEMAESGWKPWIAVDTHTLKIHHWKSRREAISGIKALLSQGRHLAVGIAQIKVSNFRTYHVDLQTALDPCGAARAVANALQKNICWAASRGIPYRQQLAAAASGYTSGSLYPATPQTVAYVRIVTQIAASFGKRG